jgi:phosphatidylserine synthase
MLAVIFCLQYGIFHNVTINAIWVMVVVVILIDRRDGRIARS